MSSTNRAKPRILIIRLSAVGDTILTLPVLCALRDHFPQAHLAWAVHAGSAPLLRGHRAIDDIYVVPKAWHRHWDTFWGLRKWVRQSEFDTVIDAQGLTKSAGIGWLGGVPQRIGFTRGEFSGRECSTWMNNSLVQPTKDHVVDQHLQLLQPLGIQNPVARFDVVQKAEDVAAIDRIEVKMQLQRGFVLIQPGAGWPSKLWPTQRYAQVTRWLWERHRINSVVLWSGEQEQAMAKSIVAASAGGGIVAPFTSLTQLAELSRRARFFLGPDTGPLHLAAAVGTTCIGMYGPMSAARCGPYGTQHIALQNVCLEGGARFRRTANNDSMKAISVEEVCAACETLMISAKAAA